MASKVGKALKSRMKQLLLVSAHPVNPHTLIFEALPDICQLACLPLEALLWGLHGDEGGRADVSCCNHCVDRPHFFGDGGWLWRTGWQPQLRPQLGQVAQVLWICKG